MVLCYYHVCILDIYIYIYDAMRCSDCEIAAGTSVGCSSCINHLNNLDGAQSSSSALDSLDEKDGFDASSAPFQLLLARGLEDGR